MESIGITSFLEVPPLDLPGFPESTHPLGLGPCYAYLTEESLMQGLYLLLSLPGVIPFYGFISDICGYIALYRYWGDWPIFILLLILGGMKDSVKRAGISALQARGHSEETMRIAAGCSVLQTAIIVICIRSF